MPDNVKFSNDPAGDLSAFLVQKAYSKIFLLADENTAKHCYPLLRDTLPAHETIIIRPGEAYKNLETCITIWQALTDNAADRHSVVIIVGGGVLGDMGGFCAATFKRGIDFILVPTTLLSQVDASIGGKLGIDFAHFKNHIGVFRFPELTLLHGGFLKTLPEPELRSGFAEVVKHALISDKKLWDEIRSKRFHEQDWPMLVDHSVRFKRTVAEKDPLERGLRKMLNAGHTVGHAIESYLLGTGRPVLHGEAIAAGLVAESFIAKAKGLLPERAVHEISRYIVAEFGKLDLDPSAFEPVSALMTQDKKNKGNKILCVLLEEVGKPRWDVEISLEEVKRALSFYQAL